MKKSLVLPAVVLALIGFGTTPAAAAQTPDVPASASSPAATDSSEPSPSNEQSAPSDDEPEAPVGHPAEATQTPSAPTGTGETDDGAQPPTPTAPGTDLDPKIGTPVTDPDAPEADPEATDTPSPNETDDAQAPIDAAVTVSPEQISESDLYFEGVVIAVSGLEPGDLVTTSLNEDAKVAQDSQAEFEYYPSDLLDAGTIEFTVTVKREGVDDQVIPARFEIVADEAYTEGVLSLSTDSLSVSEFLDSGINFTSDGFGPEESVIAAAFSDEMDTLIYHDEHLTASADGVVSGTITTTEDEDIVPGTYFAYVAGESSFFWAEFTVTKDAPQQTSDDDPAAGAGAGSGASPAGSARSGSALPRTGADLTGLSAGIALTAVGIAAVLFSRRRRSSTAG